MDFNIFSKDIPLIKTLFEKIIKFSKESDKVLFQEKIDELQKYLNDTDNLSVYKDLLSEKFHITLMTMLRTFIDKTELSLVIPVSKFLSIITEYSDEFNEALVREDIPNLLIYVTIKCGDESYISFLKDTTVIDNIIYYIMHITYHIVRHGKFQKCFTLNENINEFKETIIPWLSSKVINTRILATFVLSWLTEEDNQDKYILEKHADIIKNVSEYIKEGLRSKEKYYRGYSLWELLLGIQAMAFIDTLKVEILNADGFISALIEIISSELSEPKEIEASLGILWSLIFVENNKEILKDKYQLENVIQPFSKCKNESIKRKVKGILWELNKVRKKKSTEKGLEYDLFISYCHTDKEPILKLANVLKEHFKVWIDTDNMKGSGLSDMASGIELSKIFVMAVSKSYKQSQCCRSEANWAFKLNKPIIPLIMFYKYNPDGWLGMMISAETYIDFSEISDFEQVSSGIIKRISYKCNEINKINENEKKVEIEIEKINEETSNNERKDNENLKRQTSESNNKSTNLPQNIKEWNNHHVTLWLSSNSLSHLKTNFKEFDGGMLLAMKNMMEKTYEKYNNHLETKFKMSLTEILKFDSALSALKI